MRTKRKRKLPARMDIKIMNSEQRNKYRSRESSSVTRTLSEGYM